MNKNNSAFTLNSQNGQEKLLKDQVQGICASQITVLDCAAALAYLKGNAQNNTPSKISQPQSVDEKPILNNLAPGIRRVRYRLDIGYRHKVTPDEIKIVLVEESGVDIKNIANLRMQDCYTLIDLPDEMPQEIFHHLKTVEINEQKLDIRRVKPRNKKRGNRTHQGTRPINLLPTKEVGRD
jgi:DbpA RNA binding domain